MPLLVGRGEKPKIIAASDARRTTVRQPLPLARPDRCDYLGVRTEKLPGCNGWLCQHACSEGLPAVPGGYCQSCKTYEVDPDYKGKGIAGWLA
ncbi:MAG: hypothetical protein U0798_15060 [Gemmataceae bacterium]